MKRWCRRGVGRGCRRRRSGGSVGGINTTQRRTYRRRRHSISIRTTQRVRSSRCTVRITLTRCNCRRGRGWRSGGRCDSLWRKGKRKVRRAGKGKRQNSSNPQTPVRPLTSLRRRSCKMMMRELSLVMRRRVWVGWDCVCV